MLLTFFSINVSAQDGWVTYIAEDENFSFSVPSEWDIEIRDNDTLNEHYILLTNFSDPVDTQNKIEIYLYIDNFKVPGLPYSKRLDFEPQFYTGYMSAIMGSLTSIQAFMLADMLELSDNDLPQLTTTRFTELDIPYPNHIVSQVYTPPSYDPNEDRLQEMTFLVCYIENRLIVFLVRMPDGEFIQYEETVLSIINSINFTD